MTQQLLKKAAERQEEERKQNEFIVVAISDNKNGFGLNNFVFVSRSGEAWCGLKAKEYASEKQNDLILLGCIISTGL